MSSIVEIGSRKGNTANEPAKDDVFSASESDQVADLSHKFEQMQATEKPYQPLTEIFCSLTNQRSKKYDGFPDNSITNNNGSVDQCVFKATSTQYSSETNPKTSVMASYVMYACQTASDTLIEGIRASVKQVLQNVPRIVITGDTERNPVGCDSSSNCYTKQQDSEIWFENTNARASHNFSGGKLTSRHRSKTYYRPYCLLSRKYYNCQPLAVRRRKYGVSQKGNIEPGIDELTKLLDDLATTDERCKNQSGGSQNAKGKKKTLQYSPPPKYYMIRYRPSARLAGIKERSRSLNDLNLQGLRITRSTNIDKEQVVDNHTPSSSNVNNNNHKTMQHPSSNVTYTGSSGSQICQVVSGIDKLCMTE